uniref:Uncharacterized protein n=1 Tax=Aegilops tauschii subsp. strangulata TaxID=200361 RepID=A0A453SBM8_AEGTS
MLEEGMHHGRPIPPLYGGGHASWSSDPSIVRRRCPAAGPRTVGVWLRTVGSTAGCALSVAHGMVRVQRTNADAADCMADGAAHDHRGDDEQRDLEERHQTGSSGEGRHRNVAWLTGVVSGD